MQRSAIPSAVVDADQRGGKVGTVIAEQWCCVAGNDGKVQRACRAREGKEGGEEGQGEKMRDQHQKLRDANQKRRRNLHSEQDSAISSTMNPSADSRSVR
jgi:hypothetical protein